MKDKDNYSKNYWLQKLGTAEYTAWSGYAFETVCLHHIDQIINALGISGSYYSPCSWSYHPSDAVKNDPDADEDLKTGGQIDLLIDRKDKTISTVYVTPFGLHNNMYARKVNKQIIADDLFKKG